MCSLLTGCGRVNKETKSPTCEKLRIPLPPRSAEAEKEDGEEEDGERALLGPVVPKGRSPHTPRSSDRPQPRCPPQPHQRPPPRCQPPPASDPCKRRLRSIARPHAAGPRPLTATLPPLPEQAALRSGGGGKWVGGGAVTWSCWLPRSQQQPLPPPARSPPPPPPPPAAHSRLRGGQFNPSPAAAAAAAAAATSGAPGRCWRARVCVSHTPVPGSERESTRVRKSSIQQSRVPACLLLPAPPLLRSALLSFFFFVFFSFLPRQWLLLLLPGALSVPEPLLCFPSSSFFSSSSSLSLLLPSPFAFFFFFLPFLSFFLRLSFSRFWLQIAARSPTRAPPTLQPPTPRGEKKKKKKCGANKSEGRGRAAGRNPRKPCPSGPAPALPACSSPLRGSKGASGAANTLLETVTLCVLPGRGKAGGCRIKERRRGGCGSAVFARAATGARGGSEFSL
ncbi:uncharacterized protein [Anas platyrhynchos]|uniref:uncharacterized protein n=1 Tax=Anas platyrhynchos TaxID=8839 RepID=UPI003AF2FD64